MAHQRRSARAAACWRASSWRRRRRWQRRAQCSIANRLIEENRQKMAGGGGSNGESLNRRHGNLKMAKNSAYEEMKAVMSAEMKKQLAGSGVLMS
jgi:hypothetical protein